MSYHVYTTLGIVLDGKPSGEADKYYSIFTKELGLIIASAKSVRLSQSKLRFALNDYSLSEFSFIRGKHRWKITSSREIANIYKHYFAEDDTRDTAVRILHLLKQLLQGEEKNEALFVLVFDALQFLKMNQLRDKELKAFECVALLRILATLGYVKEEALYSSFLETSAWSSFLIDDAIPLIPDMISQINTSIEASQL